MFKILITDDIGPAGLAMLQTAKDVNYDIVKLPNPEKMLQIIGDYDAVITRSGTPLTSAVFEAGRRLKVAGRAGVGLDNIDVDTATRRGVLVMNTPEANTLAATELTMALMLASCRNLPRANASIKRGEWTRSKFIGVQLNGKTLGVIGLGRIGSRVAIRCQAFGMKVVAYDPYIAEEVAERIHVPLVGSLEELLRTAEIITVHTPLTEETRGMIGAGEIAMMKDGVRLINCARGGIVDEAALVRALESGQVASAGLDVFATEPVPADFPLARFDNVIMTPHLAYFSDEGNYRTAINVANDVARALKGEMPRWIGNPDVLARPTLRIKGAKL
jgi:D-3-phosphoglycerate dehydrogenase